METATSIWRSAQLVESSWLWRDCNSANERDLVDGCLTLFIFSICACQACCSRLSAYCLRFIADHYDEVLCMFIAWALPIKALARRISKLGVPPAAPLQMRKESSFAEIISEDAKFVTQVTRVRTRLLCGVRLCRPDHEPMHASLSRSFIHLSFGAQLMLLLVSPTDSRSACIKRSRLSACDCVRVSDF